MESYDYIRYNSWKYSLLDLNLFPEKNVVNIVRDYIFYSEDISVEEQMSDINFLSSLSQVTTCVDNIFKSEKFRHQFLSRAQTSVLKSIKVPKLFEHESIAADRAAYVTLIAVVNENYMPRKCKTFASLVANIYRLCDNKFYLEKIIPHYKIFCDNLELETWGGGNYASIDELHQKLRNKIGGVIKIELKYCTNSYHYEEIDKFYDMLRYMTDEKIDKKIFDMGMSNGVRTHIITMTIASPL